LNVEAKIKAHNRAGFSIPGTKSMDAVQWRALKDWVKANPEFRLKRGDAWKDKLFFAYNQCSAGGTFFAPASTLKKYEYTRSKENRAKKRYARSVGTDRDTRFKVWCASNLSSANTRGIQRDLNEDELRELFESHCFFCGAAPPEDKSWGIDRLQNKLGYTYDNCVPCCQVCNFAKGANDLHDFLNRVKLITERLS
jgi:hypothetical protein